MRATAIRLRAVRWTIVVPWALTVGLAVGLVVTAAIVGSYWAGSAALVGLFGLFGLWGVADATVGALIVSRRPDNRIGRILQASGPLVMGAVLCYLISAIRVVTVGRDDPLGALAGWWASISFVPAMVIALPLVATLFPDGRLPGPRWRWPVVLIFGGEVVVSGVHAISAGPVGQDLPDNPFGVLRLTSDVTAALFLAGTLLLFASLGTAVLAIAVRWRRGDRLARAQLKWLLGALTVGAILIPLSFGGGEPNILDFLGVAGATLVPLSIGIAVLRYRLYDIDRVISRTLTYALLTMALVGVYLAGFALLQTLLAPLTNGGGTIAVAVSTLAALALSQPLRRRLQSAMDRRFNRSSYDAERTVEGFAAHLRDEFDLERVGGELGAVVGRSLAPASVGVWLRRPERTVGR
jgi:hypothetical protein